MKVKNLVLIAITICCLIFAGCNTEQAEPKGSLVISAESDVSRGIESDVSLDVVYYEIKGTGPSSESFTGRIEKGAPSLIKEDLTIGEWTITATAYNASDKAIGEGSQSCTVTPGAITSCTISVAEMAGDGTLNVNISGVNAGAVFTVEVAKPNGEIVITENLAVIENQATGSYTLPNGFYKISITSDTTVPPIFESVRIVKDGTSALSYTVSEGGKIEINDIITSTPIINIDAPVSVPKNISLIASASADNVPAGATVGWYFDGTKILTGEYALSYTLPDTVTEGDHILTFCVNTDNLIWSKNVVVGIDAAIAVPEVTTTDDLKVSYGKQETIQFSVIGNTSGWTFQWYIDNNRIDGATNANQLAVNIEAVGPHTIKLEGTLNGDSFPIYTGTINCIPSISIDSSVKDYFAIGDFVNTGKAVVSPELGSYKVKWTLEVGGTAYELGEGVERELSYNSYLSATKGTLEACLMNGEEVVNEASKTVSIENLCDLTIVGDTSIPRKGERNFNYYGLSSDYSAEWITDKGELSSTTGSNVTLKIDDTLTFGTIINLQIRFTGVNGNIYLSAPYKITVDYADPYINIPERVDLAFVGDNRFFTVEYVDESKETQLDRIEISYQDEFSRLRAQILEDGKTLWIYEDKAHSSGSSFSSIRLDYYLTSSPAQSHSRNISVSASDKTMNPITSNRSIVDVGSEAAIGYSSAVSGTSYEWKVDGVAVGTGKELSYNPKALQEGTHSVSVKVNYADGSYSEYSRDLMVVKEIVPKELWYKQIDLVEGTNGSDRFGYSTIVISDEYYEESTVYVDYDKDSASEQSSGFSFMMDTKSGLISEGKPSTEGYDKLTSKKTGSSHLGAWAIPNIAPNMDMMNSLLDKFVNGYMPDLANKLVEITDAKANNIDATIVFDETLATVYADVELAASALDRKFSLPKPFNPIAKVTSEYTMDTSEVSVSGYPLGLTFNMSKDGSIMLASFYMESNGSIMKINVPLVRVDEPKYAGEKDYFQKSALLSDMLPELKQAVELINNDEVFWGMFNTGYSEGTQTVVLTGKWTITEGYDSLPTGLKIPQTWYGAFGGMSASDSGRTMQAEIRFNSDPNSMNDGRFQIYYTDGSPSYYSSLVFSNITNNGTTVTFTVTSTSDGSSGEGKSYTLTITKETIELADFLAEIIAQNIGSLGDYKVVFNSKGTVDVSYQETVINEAANYYLEEEGNIVITSNILKFFGNGGLPGYLEALQSAEVGIRLPVIGDDIVLLKTSNALDNIVIPLK